ncbi:MAG TPA: histidine kinase [Candidatus Limivivens intestinipullorum]|uniref:Stage 0 sporulation protein A homolog n=1 Tax=Candidatus Limivivens intestinipullorum TaxID=2840858 RepID=A0A9D1JJ36_9FIRM|nr:histidine kinase [Candidatus Limivivens intestinipullorum]
MPEETKKFKFWVQQVYTLLCILCTATALVCVIRWEIATFHFVLYRRRNYLNVDTVITQNLIPKLIIGTALIVLGVFCYVFYLAVLRENSLMTVVRLLFCSAGLFSCLWEYETMFYISPPARILWIKFGDIFFILAGYTFLELEYTETRKPGCQSTLKICLLLLLSAMLHTLLVPPRANITAMFLFGIVSAGIGLLYSARAAGARERTVSLLLTAAWMGISILYFQMRTSDNLFRDYHKILLLGCAAALAAVLTYFYYYRKFHLRMCLSKDVNRKIKFANRYKYEITNKLLETVENPVNLIQGLTEILAGEEWKNPKNAEHILQSMNYEITRIKKTLVYLRKNSLFMENAYTIEKVRVDISLILNEAIDILERRRQKSGRFVFANHLSEETYILSDPYYLTDAFANILQELTDLGVSDIPLEIKAALDKDGYIYLEIKTVIQKNLEKRAVRFCRLFRKKEFQHDTYREENISLICARNIVLLQGGSFFVRKNKEKMTLACRFKKYQEMENEAEKDRDDLDRKKEEEKGIIVLVSNQAEQIALISAYLATEPFWLQTFSDGREAVEYLKRTPGVILALIGEVFFRMAFFEICNEIRRSFSLAQLSVILISSRRNFYISDKRLENFNDVLETPFSRHQLLLKVYGALRLHQSEEELSKYRIDFLQNQMNPHFIFNTISTIMPLCLSAPMEAYVLLEYFAEYLRGNLFAGNLHTRVTLQRELDLIEAFLEIEKVRFQGMIETDMQIHCERSMPVMPLLIEPLVENCVVHGRLTGRVLHIGIEIAQDDRGASVLVRDDGAGICKEKIDEIYQMKDGNAFGLTNVIKRLRLYYQEELEISSEFGRGTEISFHIPYEKGKKVNENASSNS